MAPDTPYRTMRYPYTFSAKIAQFPYKYFFQYHWFYRYYLYAIAASMPLFWWIQKKSYSPENVRYWEQKDREEIEYLKAHQKK